MGLSPQRPLHRACQQNPDPDRLPPALPMVERSISWLVAGRNRRMRFRETTRNNQWLHHRVAALNLRRLLTLGLTRTAGTWVIAPAV
jgi:hypothetical protein